MKSQIKIILIVIASIVLLGSIFGTIDYIRVRNNKLPIFVIHINTDGNWDKYYGLGYVVVKNDDCENDYIKFGPYFATYACFIGSDYITDVKIVKTKECDNKAKIYYTEENRNIYTYCLDQINVDKGNKTIQLKEYLELDSAAIDFILNNFTKEPEGSYDDGGTMLYSGADFNILKCHTIAGNKDVYIGTKDMGYPNSFCR